MPSPVGAYVLTKSRDQVTLTTYDYQAMTITQQPLTLKLQQPKLTESRIIDNYLFIGDTHAIARVHIPTGTVTIRHSKEPIESWVPVSIHQVFRSPTAWLNFTAITG